jgi:hypothetical protein
MGNRHPPAEHQPTAFGTLLSAQDALNLQVHIHKESIRFLQNSENPNLYSLALSYDSKVECLITVYYLAQEVMDEAKNTL